MKKIHFIFLSLFSLWSCTNDPKPDYAQEIAGKYYVKQLTWLNLPSQQINDPNEYVLITKMTDGVVNIYTHMSTGTTNFTNVNVKGDKNNNIKFSQSVQDGNIQGVEKYGTLNYTITQFNITKELVCSK